jgi:hypothetical protein
MDKKSPEINQPISADHGDLRVSTNSVAAKSLKIEFKIKNRFIFPIFRKIFLFLENINNFLK